MSGLAVLVSGTGSILGAILGAGLEVDVVLVDRTCDAEKLAADAGVAVEVVARDDFGPGFDRTAYTDRVVAALQAHGTTTVAMAGFGTILSAHFFDVFGGRVLNTHPALLPAFKGWHAVADALAAGATTSGCTVHIATASVDDGPILAQVEVPVEPGDTVASLHERIKVAERRLYPETIRRFLQEAGA